MNTLTRIFPALVLLAALPACDKDEKDLAPGESESSGDTEGESSGDSSGGSETGDAEVVCNEANLNKGRECEGGTEFCFLSSGNEYKWGSCIAEPACEPGVTLDCEECEIDDDGDPYLVYTCAESTPLVLNFDGAPVEYGSAGKHFDLGTCAATDWPTARTPWLALDRDRSGHIDEGSELFGSATRMRAGSLADNGFTALSELDADRDGKITAADPKFSELVLWADGDADRRSSGLELQPLAALGLVSIELGYSSDRRCDARANCEVERASFVWRDGLGREQTGEVIDVHLACQ
ncbi:MAG TPA: hypothetical protein VGB85_06650 [Nannocystis sp.]|jgi:hypothetical protein